jgi:DNA-binding LacI/PurR family transcriptional regulator
METPLRKDLASAVARHLRHHVPPAHADGTIPGVRLLAKTLEVSVPTLCKALHLLEAEGFLESGGGRRKWRLADPSSQASEPLSGSALRTTSRRLLFLTPQPLGEQRFSGVEVFASLLDRLATSEWEVVYRVERFSEAKTPRRSWDELLATMDPGAMVVLGGTPVLAQWADKLPCRTLFFGGDPGSVGLPLLAVSLSTMLKDAAARLLALGHRRILLPLCARLPYIVEKCSRVANTLNTAGKRLEKSLVIEESRYMGPEVIVNLLRKHWKKDPPDAVIFLDWREFVAASGFFNRAGILIPRDVSVIILSQNTAMEWYSPAISHYEHPVKLMSRSIARWVLDENAKRDPGMFPEVKATWHERQSVITRDAPPNKSEAGPH